MKAIAYLGLAAMLSGCAMETTAQRESVQAEIAASTPIRVEQRECEAMWAAARSWVNSTCDMKIQTMTDSYIETYGSAGSTTNIACRVTKDPRPEGGYWIRAVAGCANPFGCNTDPRSAVLNFNRTVDASGAPFRTQPR